MKLTINLATRRYINMRRLNTLLVAGLVILAPLLVYQVREIGHNQAEIGKIGRQAAAAGVPVGAPAVSAEQMQSLEKRIASANDLIDMKTVNWLGLLDKLEAVVPAGVALDQVQPSLRDQTLRVTGVARSFANLRSLLENMDRSPDFAEVYLLSQTELKVGQTQQGYNFALSCKVDYR